MKIHRPKWSTIAICTGLFLFFLVILFPFQYLKGYLFTQIYQNSRILINAEEIYLSLFGWPGLGMKNVDVTIPMGNGDLDLAAKKVIFRVGLGSLFPPAPSISLGLTGLKGGGDLWVKVTRAGVVIKGSIEADKVVLSQLKFSDLPQPVQGTASIDGDFYFDETALNKSTLDMDVNIDGFHFPALNLQGVVLPAWNLGKVIAEIKTRNGNFEIAKSQLGEGQGDFQGKILGELRLAPTLPECFLNLTLKIQLSEKYRNDPNNATITSFLGGFQMAPGDYALKWASTIGGMQSNLLNALPQKPKD
jgi:type II secretion system protein N